MSGNHWFKLALVGLVALLLGGLLFSGYSSLSAAEKETHNVIGVFGTTST